MRQTACLLVNPVTIDSYAFFFNCTAAAQASECFVTTVDVTYARRCSSETNKLRYVHSIGGTSRDIAIEERGINYIKIRIVPFIINFDENVP